MGMPVSGDWFLAEAPRMLSRAKAQSRKGGEDMIWAGVWAVDNSSEVSSIDVFLLQNNSSAFSASLREASLRLCERPPDVFGSLHDRRKLREEKGMREHPIKRSGCSVCHDLCRKSSDSGLWWTSNVGFFLSFPPLRRPWMLTTTTPTRRITATQTILSRPTVPRTNIVHILTIILTPSQERTIRRRWAMTTRSTMLT